MSKILAISSQTVFGPVGLSASVPALQAMGHEVLALPTITLSHHPGHGKPVGQRTPASLLGEMLAGLQRIGALDDVDGVLTGYFADADQVEAVATYIAALKARHVLVDPVIGDHGALYVPPSVAEAIRDRLLPLASIITPNQFELTWLSGESDVQRAVHRLHITETLVTSVSRDDDQLATHLYAEGGLRTHSRSRLSGVANGTGDFLSGLYLAHRMADNPATAFSKAMAGLEQVIEDSAGSKSLKVASITAGR